METVSCERLIELASKVVEASPAAETEVIWNASCDRFARFAASGPTQSADRVVPSVLVRVRVEREGGLSEARAAADTLDPAGALGALERALSFAGHGAVSSDLVPMGGEVDVPTRSADDSVLEGGFELMAG